MVKEQMSKMFVDAIVLCLDLKIEWAKDSSS